MRQHIACDYEHKFNSATYNSNQKWSNETCQGECEFKRYRTCKKVIVGSTCVCENRKYLKSIIDEIISVMDTVSAKITNNIATNVIKNCHSKKVRYKFVNL